MKTFLGKAIHFASLNLTVIQTYGHLNKFLKSKILINQVLRPKQKKSINGIPKIKMLKIYKND